MLHAEDGRQIRRLLRKRRRLSLNGRLLESSKGKATRIRLTVPFNINCEYHEIWSYSSGTTVTEHMENPSKGLFLRVRPQSGIAMNENETSNHSQPTSNDAVDTASPSSSLTTLTSTAPTTDSSDLPRSPRHVRHYTIAAKLNAPVQGERQARQQSWASSILPEESNATRKSVIITRKTMRKEQTEPVSDSELFPGFDNSSEHETRDFDSPRRNDGEPWWEEKASALEDSVRDTTMASEFSSQPKISQARVALRRKSRSHDYPPASYRDPFAFAQEEGVPVKTRQRVKPDTPQNVPNRRSSLVAAPNSSRQPQQTTLQRPSEPPMPTDSNIDTRLSPGDSSSSSAQALSPDASSTESCEPQRMLQSRSHSRSRSLATIMQITRTNNLPDPEDVYSTEIHYFAECPHLSPPAHRPLNIQPQSVVYQPGLLRFSSIKLQAQFHAQLGFTPQVSILEGSCARCDWQVRRDAETTILTEFGLTKRRIEKQFASVGGDGELEAALAELSRAEESEVKRCWRGYTARWGPGAIGINRGRAGSSAGVSAIVSRSSSRDRSVASDGLTANFDDVVQEGRMRLDWVRPER